MRKQLKTFVGVAAATLACGMAWADEPSKPVPESPAPTGEQAAPAPPLIGDEPYEFSLKVYGWLPSLEGHAGLGKDGSSLNVSYGDVLSNLDMIQSYVPFDLDARLGHWGVTSDFLYFRAVTSTQVGPRNGVNVNVAGEQTIWEMAGYYRVGTWALDPKWGNSISLDVLGGARYNRLEGDLGVQTAGRSVSLGPRGMLNAQIQGRFVSVGGSKDWWDPFAGPRVTWNLDERFKLFARGDVGGFGIEGCSNFVWQFIGGGDWNITENCFLEAGYRMLSTNYESGSGFRHFTYDVREGGPYIAFGVKF